ncbi:hypothetical protein NUW54_g1002 [Trametes sanguinea]|uniref:Uncharacterized protein n=2 Tax=Trametes sanguinea TaxID=158606 RepID=A0ACC1Q9H0_9APHY|nr:hypothetical protein NUW54_g10775 [Trametes sanguinea]KAJ3015617.1 hypothetical protein NUW54_g1002 [Trametes sanguinea]
MAIPLLDFYADDIPDDIAHDIESFHWLLLWVVLRHTRCQRHPKEDGEALCKLVFRASDDDYGACGSKLSWLWHSRPLTVVNNEPLTTLIQRFDKMVAFN